MKKSVMRKTVGITVSFICAGMLTPFSVQAAVENGWEEVDGNYYWYENGVKQGTEGRGKEIYDPASDAWYWLDSVDNGKKATNKDVYQESDAGQWAEENGTGKWVRYDENGHMIKGWYYNENGTYYFDVTYGTMAKGNVEIDGQPCAFDSVTGVGVNSAWVTIDGIDYWYENGVRQGLEGRGKEIYDPASDAWYWLDSIDNGKKATNKDVYQESQADDAGNIGKWVRYDENGHMIKGWSEIDGNKYYFDPVYGTMAKGEVVIDGETYYFNEETGIMESVQEEIVITELNQVMYATTNVNVRSAPSADSEKIGLLTTNQQVQVTGKEEQLNWYQINYNGTIGYVSGNYLQSEAVTDTTTYPVDSSIQTLLNGAALTPNRSEFEPLNELIDELFAAIITDGMTTYEKVKACYDYLINYCSYGNNEYVYDYIWDYFSGYQYDVSAYGMLKGNIGVCDDYSATFAMLMQEIGLDCYVVTGQTSKAGGGYTGHAWCEMNINGVIYVFDPQVEDNIAKGGMIKYYRFCKTYDQVPGKYIK